MSTVQQRPSPLACIECRKKHLKCDAITPVCSRCNERGLLCNYTPSRRGCGGRVRRQAPQAHSTQRCFPPTPSYDTSNSIRRTFDTSPEQNWANVSQSSRPESSDQSGTQALTPGSTSSKSSLRSEDDHLINLYFTNFHQCHPILVPRSRYSCQNYPEFLSAVIKFVGCHFAPQVNTDAYRSTVVRQFAECGSEKSPEMVQALLLYAIALHSRYEPVEAMSAITKAADLAIELGMHNAEYATAYARGNIVYEESVRRTWWELYVADGYLASLHRHTSFKSNSVSITTSLPCEEHVYMSNMCSIPQISLDEFDGRLFSDEDANFSSFSYRIDAIRILARVIAVSTTNEISADDIQGIDNAIASWKFHLPNSKAGVVDNAGEVDQMMFQAFMFIQCASIFLHFPRSELPISMPAAAEIACAQRHMEQVSPTSSQHAAKALSASKDLANLATLPMEKHSPYFICSLVFACVVQLSACSAYPRGSTHQNRDRVALILGALKSLSRNWSIAQFVSQQLKKAAHEIFNPKPRVETPNAHASTSSYDSAIDVSSFPADMSWFDLFYPDGMQGVQGHSAEEIEISSM